VRFRRARDSAVRGASDPVTVTPITVAASGFEQPLRGRGARGL